MNLKQMFRKVFGIKEVANESKTKIIPKTHKSSKLQTTTNRSTTVKNKSDEMVINDLSNPLNPLSPFNPAYQSSVTDSSSSTSHCHSSSSHSDGGWSSSSSSSCDSGSSSGSSSDY